MYNRNEIIHPFNIGSRIKLGFENVKTTGKCDGHILPFTNVIKI
jgi:hypothetical protein